MEGAKEGLLDEPGSGHPVSRMKGFCSAFLRFEAIWLRARGFGFFLGLRGLVFRIQVQGWEVGLRGSDLGVDGYKASDMSSIWLRLRA